MTRVPEGGDVPMPETSLGRVELAFQLTQAAWAMSGKPWPEYARADLPMRRVPSFHRD